MSTSDVSNNTPSESIESQILPLSLSATQTDADIP